jgi:hypothetical protein
MAAKKACPCCGRYLAADFHQDRVWLGNADGDRCFFNWHVSEGVLELMREEKKK